MYNTSGPDSPLECAMWLTKADASGDDSAVEIGGVSNYHTVGHDNGKISIYNSDTSTRYFNVAIIQIL